MSRLATIPFEYNGGKAVTTELKRGDLLLSGWAIRFDEIDREGEGWDASSETLWRSVQKFVADRGPLAFHHNMQTIGIGRVIDAERVPGVGIRVKAIVAHQPPGSPWRHIYEGARRGFLPRFSFGGIFKRRETVKGPVIEDADFVELSICGSSVGRGTTWELLSKAALSVPEGKAISASGEIVSDPEITRLHAHIRRVEADVIAYRAERLMETLR